MQKRLVANLLLFLLVIVLAIFFSFSDKRNTAGQTVRLSKINPVTISHISIRRPGTEAINFQRSKTGWRMLTPFAARANPARINAMLHLPQSRSLAQIKVGQASLRPYGLQHAALVLSLDEYAFAFGTSDPLDGRRYVMFNHAIHLLNDSLYYQLRQPPLFFVSPRLVAADEIITSIQFSGQLVSRREHGWSVSPANPAITTAQLQDLASAWQSGKAYQLETYTGADTREKITVHFRNGHTALFDVVSGAPALVLGRADPGLAYHLDKGTANSLMLPQTQTNNATE